MPVTFLDEAEQARLNSFPEEILPEDLKVHFTLSSVELNEVNRHYTPVNRLGFALQLGALRYLGYCPDDITSASQEIVDYLALQLDLDPTVLKDYGSRDKTRTQHAKEAQAFLGYRPATLEDFKELTDWLVGRALEHNNPLLLLGLAAQKLKQGKVIRPGITRLARVVVAAREKAQSQTYQLLAPLFTHECLTFLDSLLKTDGEISSTRLEWLRQEAEVVSPRAIGTNLAKLEWLQKHGVNQLELTGLNPNRRKLLAGQGRKTTAYALQHLAVQRRYPILLAFVVQSYQDLVDETLDLFCDYVAEVNRRAQSDLEEFRQQVARATDEKVRYFQAIGSLILNEEIPPERLREYTYGYLSRDELEAAVKDCQRLIRPDDNSFYDFLLSSYKMIRSFSPKFLEIFTFHSNPATAPLLTALATLREFNQSGKKQFSNHSTLSFVPGKWINYVLEANGSINRYYYELAALWELRAALRGGNVWVEGSRRYASIESYFISKEEWFKLRPEVCNQLGTGVNGAERLNALGQELEMALTRLEKQLGQANTGNSGGDGTRAGAEKVRIEEGKFILTPLEANEMASSLSILKTNFRNRLPWVELVSLLIEVDRWTGFSRCFEHAGGGGSGAGEYEPPFDEADKSKYLYGCLLTQSTNMNLSRLEKASGLAADNLLYHAKWYLREETLQKAIKVLVNYQFHQPLSKYWGGGTLSSSDGQRFPVATSTRKARALPRYFGYGQGLTFYTWTSDQHSQFGSKVIVSTDRDALYVLDALMDNETELPLLEHTTDTAGFTDIIFGLFSLLGLQFSPRIRDIGEQRLYRLERLSEHPTLKPMIKETINQRLIVEQWDELLRLAGSIKLGWVTASLLIGKLQSFPQQNKLAQALAEYGKLVKTIFILRYYESETYRHRIEAQLNKGEGLHFLREFIFFANRGELRKNQSEDQSNQAYCLTLVTNAVIVWNTIYMAEILEQLKAGGSVVEEGDLPHVSPTRFEHLNVYGRYSFNVEEEWKREGLRSLRS